MRAETPPIWRQNLITRRFKRLTNGHSKKINNRLGLMARIARCFVDYRPSLGRYLVIVETCAIPCSLVPCEAAQDAF